jgi:ABC-type polysaccharide/polyol phosphate export permease
MSPLAFYGFSVGAFVFAVMHLYASFAFLGHESGTTWGLFIGPWLALSILSSWAGWAFAQQANRIKALEERLQNETQPAESTLS